MGRYDYQNVRKTERGRRVFTTTRYPIIPKKVSDIYVLADVSDRLDSLADQFYNDTSLWWIIAQANNVGKGTLRLTEGQQLRIPVEIKSIVNEFKRLNNVS